MFRKILDEGQAGDNVGSAASRRGEGRSGARHGDLRPGISMTPHTKFEGEVYILTKEEGGRHTAVLQGLPSPVLLPDDGRDGSRELPGGDARW